MQLFEKIKFAKVRILEFFREKALNKSKQLWKLKDTIYFSEKKMEQMHLLRYIKNNTSQESEIDTWRNIFKFSYFNSVFFIKFIFKLEIIL